MPWREFWHQNGYKHKARMHTALLHVNHHHAQCPTTLGEAQCYFFGWIQITELNERIRVLGSCDTVNTQIVQRIRSLPGVTWVCCRDAHPLLDRFLCTEALFMPLLGLMFKCACASSVCLGLGAPRLLCGSAALDLTSASATWSGPCRTSFDQVTFHSFPHSSLGSGSVGEPTHTDPT